MACPQVMKTCVSTCHNRIDHHNQVHSMAPASASNATTAQASRGGENRQTQTEFTTEKQYTTKIQTSQELQDPNSDRAWILRKLALCQRCLLLEALRFGEQVVLEP